jgi:serine/threonine-protein kinase RIO1
MTRLYRSGADVPEPLASGYNAKLIPKPGCDDLPSPVLNTEYLVKRDARQIFDRMIQNVEIILANQHIHSDISAYNILCLEC